MCYVYVLCVPYVVYVVTYALYVLYVRVHSKRDAYANLATFLLFVFPSDNVQRELQRQQITRKHSQNVGERQETPPKKKTYAHSRHSSVGAPQFSQNLPLPPEHVDDDHHHDQPHKHLQSHERKDRGKGKAK